MISLLIRGKYLKNSTQENKCTVDRTFLQNRYPKTNTFSWYFNILISESLGILGFQHFGTLYVKGLMYTVKLNAMKTKLNFAMILFLLITILPAGRNVSATTTGKDTLALTTTSVSLPVAEEESYVDDIPFNTEKIALESLYMNLVKPEEEAYINDIPFETSKVAAAYISNLLNIRPEAEAYVDDIPFNTSEIAADYKLNCGNIAATDEKTKCTE